MTDLNSLTDQNETPEDVATLYSWANLHGAKYRDFSASRAQTREKARLRAEQAMEEARRASLQDAGSSGRAAEALEKAKAVEAAHPPQTGPIRLTAGEPAVAETELASQHAAEQARLADEEQARALSATQAAEQAKFEAEQAAQVAAAAQAAHAAAEHAAQVAAEQARVHAAYVAAQEAAAQAAREIEERAALQAQIEAERHAQQQAALEAAREAEQKQAALVAAQQAEELAALESAKQAEAQAALAAAQQAEQLAVRERAAQAEAVRERAAHALAAEELEAGKRAALELAAQPRAQQAPAAEERPWPKPDRFPVHSEPIAADAIHETAKQENRIFAAQQASTEFAGQGSLPVSLPDSPSGPLAGSACEPASGQATKREESYMSSDTPWAPPESQESNGRPAWLNAEKPEAPNQPVVQAAAQDDTLQGSRDRLTSRWFALRGIFDGAATPAEPTPLPVVSRAPAMAVFSLAGGVGKTSLVATLGRALSAKGERVLLVDTAAFGLLPFFFGATDQRPGVLRTFNPPGLSNDAPIQMVTIDPEDLEGEAGSHESLSGEIGKYARGAGRVIVDLATASGATTRRIMRMAPLVLVPVVADMNSVVSVSSIDAFFEHNSSAAGRPMLPYYLLNQFDPSLPLHLDVREVLREQLGDRLLPFAMRRTPAMSEALAEGMTVIDYAPGSPLSEDFSTLAGWVKSLSAPATASYRGVRWSER